MSQESQEYIEEKTSFVERPRKVPVYLDVDPRQGKGTTGLLPAGR